MAQRRKHVYELFLLRGALETHVDRVTGGVAVEGGADFVGGGEDDVEHGRIIGISAGTGGG